MKIVKNYMPSLLSFFVSIILSFSIYADINLVNEESNLLDELNPRDNNIQEILKSYDEKYEAETGKSALLKKSDQKSDCYRNSCAIWASVNKDRQEMNLYINGALTNTWPVSTGKMFYKTPDFDTHPDGRLYDAHNSSKYPGGDYNGLGNMPYAVFIDGGYAIHGTTKGNWGDLGSRASHGCIRLHPDNAKIFIELVRKYGISNVWITVE